MSRTSEVLKNKNRAEKSQRNRRKKELDSLRMAAAFKAKLSEELKKVDVLLESDEIDCIVITIPDNYLAKFGEAVYADDLAEYDIQQVEGTPNQFYVRHKFLQF